MSATPDQGFSVLAMAQEYARQNDMNADDIFKKPEPTQEATQEITPEPEVVERPEKKEWTPDASLLEGMPELQNKPTTYLKEDYEAFEVPAGTENITDVKAIEAARETMAEGTRIAMNLEDVKARHGISKLGIPPGEYHVKLTAAAADTNYMRSQTKLDELLHEIEEKFPQFILERTQSAEMTDHITEEPDSITEPEQSYEETPVKGEEIPPETDSSNVEVTINKTDLHTVNWTDEDLQKVRKARSIELKIVDAGELKFRKIVPVRKNNIDLVLSQYQRKTNDITSALPASKYRATFTGLSYPEVMDLENSRQLNERDELLQQCTICFRHTVNPSIGPWEEYNEYPDPETGELIKAPVKEPIPSNVDRDDVTFVSAFDDFLRKTSYLDLPFMVWKILCATAMDTEIAHIRCGASVNNVRCNHRFDWVYRPENLLIPESIGSVVVDDMEKTMNASTKNDILENYQSSLVCSMNSVELPVSGWYAIYGHRSLYEYLNEFAERFETYLQMAEEQSGNRSEILSDVEIMTSMIGIRAILIPQEDGSCLEIRDVGTMLQKSRELGDMDWSVLFKISRMAISPYLLQFKIQDVVCPKCHKDTPVTIQDVGDLLFTVAQSLRNAQVELKTT